MLNPSHVRCLVTAMDLCVKLGISTTRSQPVRSGRKREWATSTGCITPRRLCCLMVQSWSLEATQMRIVSWRITIHPSSSLYCGFPDVNATMYPGQGYKYYTEYRVEIFYPDYYDNRRPAPTGTPTAISYGGNSFDVSLSKDDLFGEPMNILNTKAVLIRTGFSTHGPSFVA